MLYDFFGLEMQQKPTATYLFSQLLADIRPERIIELGTGLGGLTALLGLYGHTHECHVVTYDNDAKDERYVELFAFLGVDRRVQDIFEKQGEIEDMIGEEGTTLLLCDNGNKVREVNVFANALKIGDVIMAHDYHTVMTQDPRIIGEDTVCEICYDQIADVCFNCSVVEIMNGIFVPAMWFCGQRSAERECSSVDSAL